MKFKTMQKFIPKLKHWAFFFKIIVILLSFLYSIDSHAAIPQNKCDFTIKGTASLCKHQALGIEFEEEGKIDLAIVEYKKGLEYDSDDVATLFNLGRAYLKANKPLDASIVLHKVTNISHKDYEAYNLLGIAHGGIQEYAAAILVWEKSL